MTEGTSEENQTAQRSDPAAFYDSRPWRDEYGTGIPTDLKPLPYQNMAELIRSASKDYPDNKAFTICLDNGLNTTLNYRDVDALSDQFAAFLRFELGLQKGDRVALQMPNCLTYPVATFGVLKAGLVLVNVNPLYTASEMNKQLVDSGSKALVIIDMFANKLDEGLKGSDVKHVVIASAVEFFPTLKRTLLRTVMKLKGAVPKVSMPHRSFADALKAGKKHLKELQAQPVSLGQDDLAALQYTGGTTGIAKGAELTHGNLLANVSQTRTISGDLMRPGKDTILTALPLYHIFAFTTNMVWCYMMGCHNVLSPSPRPVSNLRPCFEKFDITKFTGVNLLYHGLTHEEWFIKNPPRNLDMAIAGGTALLSGTAARWKEIVGTEILQGYGLSETSPTLTVNPRHGENRMGTVGIPVPGTDIRIVDENDNPLPPGEAGELVAKGPQVMRGYWKKPEETAKVMKDGWFHTGDVAVMDERGYVTIVDRKKDMIDVSGFNVYPNEVEDCLDRHPDVVEVAVIGVPNAEGGERVRAYVVSSNPHLTPDALIEHCRKNLTAYKVPKEIVFREELPKTPVGKVLRKDLRKEAEQEQAAKATA